VLLNLAINAGHAIASARPTDGEAGVVTLRVARAGEHVRVEVEDTGPGIPKGIRDRLFEPFVTTKEVGAGTGLGLAVCRGIVHSAGGDISLDESYAAGARFIVLLPQAP
jgi:two-component system NtrC family sensor kinase